MKLTYHFILLVTVSFIFSFYGSFANSKSSSLVVSKKGNEYQLSRSAMNREVSSLPTLLQQARVVPKTDKHGNINCYKFEYLKKNSVYSKIGLRTDDCIYKINGNRVTSPQQAFLLFTILRNNEKFKLEVLRGKRVSVYSYTVVQ